MKRTVQVRPAGDLREDAVRLGLAKIDEATSLAWLRTHLDYCLSPLLGEPWVPLRHGVVAPTCAGLRVWWDLLLRSTPGGRAW